VLFFEFRKVRLHRHAACLLNQCLPDELTLAQTQCKGDGTPAFAPQQMGRKSLISEGFLARLNAAVENAIILMLLPVTDYRT
jgi:hypothetical protein